jgi:hypothetical protein
MSDVEVDFEQVSAWCEQHDQHPVEGWLCMLLDGTVTVAELRAAILEDRTPRLADEPTCELCGEGTDDQGTCGPCGNCKLPLCMHDDKYDVHRDGNVCPRACNALSPQGEVCDDTIAHEGPHRWAPEADAP